MSNAPKSQQQAATALSDLDDASGKAVCVALVGM
jgi:hypothetical protein